MKHSVVKGLFNAGDSSNTAFGKILTFLKVLVLFF